MSIDEKEKPKRQQSNWRRVYIVVAGAIVYGLITRILIGFPGFGNFLASDTRRGETILTIGFLALTPFAVGAASMYFAPVKRQSSMLHAFLLSGFTGGILFPVFAAIFNLEIWICCFMVSPLMAGMAGLGGMLGYRLVKQKTLGKQKHINSFIMFTLFAPYVFAPLEAQFKMPDTIYSVDDQIIIDSTPDIIWQNIIRMDSINPEYQPSSFFHLIGIPRPVRATLDYEGIGGIRRGEFEYGLTFVEEITVWEPEKTISFSILVDRNELATPALEQIGGRYFDILEATYRIEQLENGQVILHLSSRYRLSTSFNFYASIWSDLILHDFQSYVLNVVKQRTES